LQDLELEKTHDILFTADPVEQAENAFRILSGIDKLTVKLRENGHGITVTYNLLDYTLQGLESALINQGFVLNRGLIVKAKRAIIHYEEETQLANLREPTLQDRKKKEIFTHVYEHHKHGDQDDTPPEWREYK
jgi:hypothetical protein